MYNKVYVEITNICNRNCSFCPGHNRPPRRMTMGEFSLILDKLAGQTKYIYYHLMGEPLTHPLLPDFIKLSKSRGFNSIITTNGTLLKKRGDEMLSAGVHKVNISLHSFENETDEQYREYIFDLASYAQNAAIQETLTTFRLWNKGHDGGRNDIAIKHLKEKFTEEWVENTRGYRIWDKVFLEWGERFEWPDSNAEIKGEIFSCYGLKDHFGILSDGTVVPCCLDNNGTINLGNIFCEELDAILDSPRANRMVACFKRGYASEDLCKRCGYAQRFV